MRKLGGQQAQIARHSALSPLCQQRVKCIMTSSRSPSQATWIATDSSTQDHQRLGVVQLATSRSHQESKQEQVSSRCCTSARSVQQLLSSNLVNGNMCTPPGKKPVYVSQQSHMHMPPLELRTHAIHLLVHRYATLSINLSLFPAASTNKPPTTCCCRCCCC